MVKQKTYIGRIRLKPFQETTIKYPSDHRKQIWTSGITKQAVRQDFYRWRVSNQSDWITSAHKFGTRLGFKQ